MDEGETMNQQLIGFYRGERSDIAGRTIDQIWAFDFGRLEQVHDYIQWLFPSGKPSNFNPHAPLLDPETIEVFRGDPDLQSRLRKSLEVMLSFYGLELSFRDSVPSIDKSSDYHARRAGWQDAPPGHINHNLLRLTRILEALSTLGLPDCGVALYECLEAIQQEQPLKIPGKTLALWQQAIETP
jgi:hypothetical protein